MNPMKPIIVLEPKYVPKAWGSEHVICNNEEFCGKILKVEKGRKFSMHFHANKREVFFLMRGRATLRWIDTETAKERETLFFAHSGIEIPRFTPHQIEAIEDSEIIEFSTHHEDSDSYRVAPGDSQK